MLGQYFCSTAGINYKFQLIFDEEVLGTYVIVNE